jgi:hypothetical protein
MSLNEIVNITDSPYNMLMSFYWNLISFNKVDNSLNVHVCCFKIIVVSRSIIKIEE